MELLANADALVWVDPLVRLATAGGFGALVWYFIVKHIPGIEKRHRDERQSFLDYIKERDDKLEAIVKDYYGAVESVRDELREITAKLTCELS